MNIKQNTNYFKISDKFSRASVLVFGGGVVSMLLAFFGLGRFIFFTLAGLLLPVGFVMYLIGTTQRATDEDIRVQIEQATQDMEVDLSKITKYQRRIVPGKEPRELSGFDYDDGLMFTKTSRNSNVISSSYTKALLYQLKDEFYIVRRKVSLVSEDVLNEVIEIPFVDISTINYITERKTVTFEKNTYEVELTKIEIKYGENEIISFPIGKDVEAEAYTEKLLKTVLSAKENA